MTFKNSDGGFSHIENGKSNNIACYQALNSLVDLYKYMSKGNTEIFEFDDTKKIILIAKIPDRTLKIQTQTVLRLI